jgi:hypothetical protein
MSAPVRIFRERVKDHVYAIGIDPALGFADSDDSVIEVWNCTTGEQAAEVQGKLDGNVMAEEAWLLGLYYNEALIGCEVNKDLTCVNRLNTSGYPHIYFRREETGRAFRKQTDKLGWDTNLRTRPMLVTQGRNMIRDGSVIMLSQKLVNQWKHFVLENGKFQALAGAYDDLVMASLICWEMMKIQLSTADSRTKTVSPLVDGEPVYIDEDEEDARNIPISKRLSQHVMKNRRQESLVAAENFV